MTRGKYEAAREKARLSYKSYIIGLICLGLCCALFVSSTFAWLSEDVGSNVNQIYVGSMQVDFLHHVNGQQVAVTPNHSIFDNNIKWKPEAAQTQTMTVVNKGNIAFEYELQLIADPANCAVDNGQNFFDVANYFDVYAFAGASEDISASGWQKVGTLAQVIKKEIAVTEGLLENSGDTATFSVGLLLRDDADPKIMGQQLSFHVKLVANQEGYVDYQKVGTAGELTAALAAGDDVQLTANISAPAATVAPYGNFYGFKHDGSLLDGAGHTLSVTGSGETYGIMTSGGTIKNLKMDNGFRGIVLMYAQEDLILENVTLVGSGIGYSINTAEHGLPVQLIVRNSTLSGWASFAGLDSASFTRCTFRQGSYWGGTTYDRVVKPMVDTLFENCDFANEQYIDLSELDDGCKVIFDKCTVNGAALTAENWNTLFEAIELPAGKTIADCVVFR